MVSGFEATDIPILCVRRGLLFSFTYSQIFPLRSNCVGCAHLTVTVSVACHFTDRVVPARPLAYISSLSLYVINLTLIRSS